MKKLTIWFCVICLVGAAVQAGAAERSSLRFKKSPDKLQLAGGPRLLGDALTQADPPPPAPAVEGAPPAAPSEAPSVHAAPDAVMTPGGPPVATSGAAVPLFDCVKYRQERNIAPCAAPMIVMVKDPCACDDPCSCCAPKCVAVQICVPPCGCPPKISCKADGARIRYDYGKYAVDITSRRGVVVVDYDD